MPPQERRAAEERSQPDVADAGPEIGLGEYEHCAEEEQPDAEQEPRSVAMLTERLDGR
jgi:hypothetical protein